MNPAKSRLAASIIVISFNEGPWVRRTIESLIRNQPADSEIILVDDVSDDGSTDGVATDDRIRFFRPDRRLGVARARNFGARRARGETLIFSDAHVRVPPNWFSLLQDALDNETTGAVAPALVEWQPTGWIGCGLRLTDTGLNWDWLPRRGAKPYQVPMVGGGFFAIRKRVYCAIGGCDPGFGIWGMEDMELMFRLWAYGYDCMVVPAVRVAHYFREPGAYPRYQTNWQLGLRNVLRVAVLHLGERRLAQVFRNYVKDPQFAGSLASLALSDAWTRRAALAKARRRPEESFFTYFGVDW
jgi:GT2 family glycosyltransferase